MDFRYTEEQEAFRKEVSDWLDKELTPDVQRGIEGWTFTRVPNEGISHHIREFNTK